jgi:polyhydroxybutyrate depolymerase
MTDELGPGDHTRKLEIDGRERSYLVHVHEGSPAGGLVYWPVVLAFHGSGTNARLMQHFSGLSDKADAAGFVVVYPNGTGHIGSARTFNAGNCCGHALKTGVDDVGFTAAILDDLAAALPVDTKRVYATGMSNGAMMTYRLAAELSERIAAIAPVAGPLGLAEIHPRLPVPVCHFHGDHDAYAPYQGGIGPLSISKTNFLSVDFSIRSWVQANGCDSEPLTEALPCPIEDGTSITRQTYSGGIGGSEVILYTIHGGGHTWPGREPIFPKLGPWTRNLIANDVLWDFFQRFSR